MKIKKSIVIYLWAILLLTVGGNVWAQQLDSLTLGQVIQRVLDSNPLMEQSDHTIEAAKARIELSKSSTYPFVAGDLSYDRIGPVPTLSIPDMGSFSLFPEDNYDAHVAAQYTVFDFGLHKTQEELAQNGLEVANENKQATQNRLAYGTVKVFYSILFLQEEIKVLDEEIGALKSHLEVTQKKAQTGSATSFDVLTTRVRVSNAGNEKVDAENALQKQLLQLKSLMGIDKEKDIHLKGGFSSESSTGDQEMLLTQALNQRPEMKLAVNSVTRAEIESRLASLSDKASLKVNGLIGVKNGYIPDLNKPMFNWVAGIGIHVPLFDGYVTRYKEQQAQANLTAVKAYGKEVKRQISTEVNQAIEDVLARNKKLDAANLQLEQATEAVSLANKQYENGVVTNLELLDAQAALAQSKLLKSKAMFSLVLSEYMLDQAAGKKIW